MLDLEVAGARGRQRERDRDRLGARGRHVRAAADRLRGEADPRRRQVRAREPRRGGSTACSSACPKGVELDQPLYVKVTSNGGSLYWRMVVEAEEGARFTLIEDLSSAGPDTVAYTNAVVEVFVEREREGRVRLAPEPLAGDVALRPSQGVARAGHRARLGDRRLRLEARQGLDRERPRRPGCDLARHRRVLRRRRPAPRLRHLPGAHRAEHGERLRVQGRAPGAGDAPSGAG